MEQQNINPEGLNLIKNNEALRLIAYRDSVGVWTIGWGHTHGVRPGEVITEVQAEALLQQDLTTAEACVNKVGERVALNSNQFSALVSFVFNVGTATFETSTLHTCLLNRDFAGAAGEFPRWVHGRVAGREVVLPELVNRRRDERALFMRPTGVA